MRTLGLAAVAVVSLTCSGTGTVPLPDGGSGGGAGTGGGSGTGGGGTAGAGGGAGGGTPTCSPACAQFRDCCNGACVNTANDPLNCGICGRQCTGATSYCSGGTCTAPQCNQDAGACGAGTTCCGQSCCGADQYCCANEGPVGGLPPQCRNKDAGTCPQGCAPLCASDRAVKRDVLEQISSMRFVVQAGHLGPTADPIDVHGTSLAAIQALHAELKAQAERLDRLETENARLRAGVCAP